MPFSSNGETSLCHPWSAGAAQFELPQPEGASNAQFVRFLFFTGRVHAVQLRYSEAHRALLQAVRKAVDANFKGLPVVPGMPGMGASGNPFPALKLPWAPEA